MNSNNSEALFADLLSATDLSYISDLHYRDYYHKILHALGSINVDNYSAEVWTSVASYISGSHRVFEYPYQAVEYLVEFLSSN